jgi:hypothetical protein
MKSIEKAELFSHLGQFLKAKGIELKDGSYANGIQKSCGLLTDVINLSQKGVERAKSEVDKKLDQMRQCIHEKTAPKRPASAAPPRVAAVVVVKPAAQRPGAGTPRTKARKPKPSKPKS